LNNSIELSYAKPPKNQANEFMKNYAKVGNRKGKPAYRTPSRFIYKKSLEAKKAVARAWNLASRLEFKNVRNKKFRKPI